MRSEELSGVREMVSARGATPGWQERAPGGGIRAEILRKTAAVADSRGRAFWEEGQVQTVSPKMGISSSRFRLLFAALCCPLHLEVPAAAPTQRV